MHLARDVDSGLRAASVKASVRLQNTRASGPPGDIGPQERGEVVRAWRQLFSTEADPAEVQVDDGIDQSAHHDFAVSAGR